MGFRNRFGPRQAAWFCEASVSSSLESIPVRELRLLWTRRSPDRQFHHPAFESRRRRRRWLLLAGIARGASLRDHWIEATAYPQSYSWYLAERSCRSTPESVEKRSARLATI